MHVIDINLEDPVPLAILAREIPNRQGRRGVNASTTWRWVLRGINGQRLESVMVGGIRMSSREALARFFAATTSAANGDSPVTLRNSKQREANDARADSELAEEFGI